MISTSGHLQEGNLRKGAQMQVSDCFAPFSPSFLDGSHHSFFSRHCAYCNQDPLQTGKGVGGHKKQLIWCCVCLHGVTGELEQCKSAFIMFVLLCSIPSTPFQCAQPQHTTAGIFRCGKLRISNVCEISRSILRPLCKINLCQNLATMACHHPTLVWLGFSFLWCLL